MGIPQLWAAVEALADDAHGVSMMVKIVNCTIAPVCEKGDKKRSDVERNFGESPPTIVMV